MKGETMESAIAVRNLTKTYDNRSFALNGVFLDVHRGELMMLKGPSGSGKTTLLSIMGCILRPTSGEVWIHGKEIAHLSESSLPQVRLRNIGFIFQGFNLFPTLTAAENVELALDLKGIRGSGAKKRSRLLLDQVGLETKYDAYPADLSGGQKQRVAIARALSGEPGIILADEPTASLDSTSGRSVMELMQSLAHDEGRAIVIVTHDNRIEHFADRAVHISDGQLYEQFQEAS
jgi:putative ABC transport system ATP-binding protein